MIKLKQNIQGQEDSHNDLSFPLFCPPAKIIENKIEESISDSNTPCLSESEWMTTDEAAYYLRISKGSLYNLTSSRKLLYQKLGGRNRYLKSELRKLLLQNTRGTLNGN